MGPIEAELRKRAEVGQYGKPRLGCEAYWVFIGAIEFASLEGI